MRHYIENKIFDEIRIGDKSSVVRSLTEQDIKLFAIMSGDINPAHLDVEYAKSEMFHKIIAHGMWGGAVLSSILGTKFPGPGTIYLSQTLKFLRPVTIGDVITATVTVIARNQEKHRLTLECTCVNQLGTEVIQGVAEVIAPINKIKRLAVELPDVILCDSAQWYNDLIKKRGNLAPLITAVVHPVDRESLLGAFLSASEGLIDPILIGPASKIKDIAEKEHLDISPYRIIDTEHSHEAAEIAVKMAKSGEVEALMKGKLHTDELMSCVVNRERGIRTARRISHVFAMRVPNYHKPLYITDAAININPNLTAKCDIVQNAIDLFRTVELTTPKVALISAVETVNQKIPSTLDATAICKMSDRGQITGAVIDGPLAFDNAISKESARIKGISSPVAGEVDIIMVPDLESGNILYKQLTLLSGVEAAGIVLGARVPIVLTSRISNTTARLAVHFIIHTQIY